MPTNGIASNYLNISYIFLQILIRIFCQNPNDFSYKLYSETELQQLSLNQLRELSPAEKSTSTLANTAILLSIREMEKNLS